MQRLTALLASLLVSGCCSYEARPLTQRKASTIIDSRNLDGFIFSAKLRFAEDYQEDHFCAYPTDSDILPVELFLENQSDTWNYDVRFSRTSLTLTDGTRLEVVPLKDVVEEMAWSGWSTLPLWFVLVFPGAIALGDVYDANEQLEADYKAKVLEDVRLPVGGQAVQGIVFLRAKDKSLENCVFSGASLKIDVTKIAGEQVGDQFQAEFFFD